jgi:hypothetical protein
MMSLSPFFYVLVDYASMALESCGNKLKEIFQMVFRAA